MLGRGQFRLRHIGSDLGLGYQTVDASLIDAPSFTRNKEGKRDREMHQTRKGSQWYFGIKMQFGVNDMARVVHTLVATAANMNDVTEAHHLLQGEEI